MTFEFVLPWYLIYFIQNFTFLFNENSDENSDLCNIILTAKAESFVLHGRVYSTLFNYINELHEGQIYKLDRYGAGNVKCKQTRQS